MSREMTAEISKMMAKHSATRTCALSVLEEQEERPPKSINDHQSSSAVDELSISREEEDDDMANQMEGIIMWAHACTRNTICAKTNSELFGPTSQSSSVQSLFVP